MREINPDVLKIQFISEHHQGVGTRFRETRRMGSREMETELEVTVFDAPHRARMVTDSHGTVWDTLFEVAQDSKWVTLTMTLESLSHGKIAALLNKLFARRYRSGMEKHLDAVKAYCETRGA